MIKIFAIFSIFIFIVMPMFGLAPVAKADSNSMLWGGHEQNVQVATGLGNTDPRTMAGSVLKVLLGFLGIIAVLLILYGGFKWMTAAGDEGDVDTAKKIISAGVIGLVIILASFAVSQFVINALYNATGATG
ncbi:hypothetical protein A2303_01450 [Candidatus Falkowbacteria bacterium RIFOXYB2_FULL_47_14]|uniref:Uncharacterized protein n=1 Tax=Candidatus Falkowbacteria bacterium RIFOXYA2_FULL_47_19 TaxID=1797994 RepID=A0A1F5SLG6_9BACT|nr:MAG: hypothetical protein A2227_01525 [Candidatus Falkowbacteria bacterium RIFOXYA2_FULL_47_19]OGF34760.1 MAG: hypothetical protein A2468_03415 [Candidatus Falkowbacteria bacterium RIFOXYC2_FULL_46_15]OGF43450.1 MAG: hypothetical protein A2303_01450 [Candidatus Falkowbacteria bacterium RIFOXYB2_FULL_47_14]